MSLIILRPSMSAALHVDYPRRACAMPRITTAFGWSRTTTNIDCWLSDVNAFEVNVREAAIYCFNDRWVEEWISDFTRIHQSRMWYLFASLLQ